MNEYIKMKVKEEALKSFPNECCGFICVNYLGQVTVLPCENKAYNKKSRFVIDPDMNFEAEKYGHVAAFYHSHADECAITEHDKFSTSDIDISNEAGIPALLYVYPQDTWHFHIPDSYETYPLIGRPFVWGIWDCFSVVRDFYRDELKVNLGFYFPPAIVSRNTNFGYEENFAKEGFEQVPLETIQKGDVVLFKMAGSNHINHSAIYLGDNKILHQPINKTSNELILDDRYLKYIHLVLRRKL